ncbi:hypothetical protein AAF463_24075 (plasmid) [Pantoea sp. BJ2]|uniref:Uncharacterized protein n=1 Tax=Pantoea sp. BJ2 TaxID=3141322 RepID=A0AAU7U4B9_9GAMM
MIPVRNFQQYTPNITQTSHLTSVNRQTFYTPQAIHNCETQVLPQSSLLRAVKRVSLAELVCIYNVTHDDFQRKKFDETPVQRNHNLSNTVMVDELISPDQSCVSINSLGLLQRTDIIKLYRAMSLSEIERSGIPFENGQFLVIDDFQRIPRMIESSNVLIASHSINDEIYFAKKELEQFKLFEICTNGSPWVSLENNVNFNAATIESHLNLTNGTLMRLNQKENLLKLGDDTITYSEVHVSNYGLTIREIQLH